MDLQALSKPFPEELIKTRKGNWGSMLHYVEAAPVINRLNEVFGGEWSFSVLWPQDLSFYLLHAEELQVVGVLGKLEVDGASKQQFGGSMVTRNSETGEIINIMDDLKAAASDSLKKCATHLGVALYLYEDDGKHTKEDARKHNQKRTQQRTQQDTSGESAKKGAGQRKTGGITQSQLKEIGRLTETLGLTEEDVAGQITEIFGKPTDKLDYKEASEVIRRMKARVNG